MSRLVTRAPAKVNLTLHILGRREDDGYHELESLVAFTGSGNERVVMVLSDRPLSVEAVRASARGAWEAAGGKVEAMTTLGSGGEETHWLLRKP